ncbi:MAG: alpha/beta fold hydrolase [Deltaproteobacteria bacterium]
MPCFYLTGNYESVEMSTLEQLRTADSRQDEAWAAANPEAVKQMGQGFQAAKAALQADPKAWEGWSRQAEAVLKHDAFGRLHLIKADTLVFNGRYDGSQPPEVLRAMAERIPNARFELVDHGHGSWYFDPAVWDMVIDFLKIRVHSINIPRARSGDDPGWAYFVPGRHI